MKVKAAMLRKRIMFASLVTSLLLMVLSILPSAQGSSPPKITYIDFPQQIQAGEAVTGYIFFKDLDGDIAKVKFELIEGERSTLEIKPDWEFDPGVEGETEGTIEFQIIPRVSQRITMKVTLFDKAGNSGSSKFSFEIVGNEPPVAKFSFSPSTPRAGETVRFDGSTSEDPDGSIVAWSWDFGDGSSGSGAQTTHTYSAEGRYKVTLQVTDDKGALGSASKTIKVLKPNQPPAAKFTFSPAEPEVGEAVTFDASDSYDPDGQITNYTWAFGDGSTGHGKLVTHSYSSARTYTVTLKVIDDGGLSDTVTHRVTAHPKPQSPVAKFTFSPSQPEVGQSVTFDASDSYDPDGSIKSYKWSFGDGANGTGKTTSHSYSRSGSYTVTLRVTDNDGLTSSLSKVVRIKEKPKPNQPPVARFTFSPSNPEEGEIVNFDASGSYDPDGTIARYEWDFGDGSSGAGREVTHRFTSKGSYIVSLTVTDDKQATNSISKTVTVRQTQKTVFVTKSFAAPKGAILKLDLTTMSAIPIVTRLDYPGGIVCSPQGQLYVEEGTTITRFNQDGSDKTLILKDRTLWITELALAPNGDLFFGTWDKGVWRIKDADPHSPPEQVIPESWPSSYFVSGLAFITTGPFKGDLLIAVGPNRGSGGFILRAPHLAFNTVKTFIEDSSITLATDVAVNPDGDIFVTDWTGGKVLRYAPDGTPKGIFAEFSHANQIAFDSSGTAYVTNAVYRGSHVTGGVVIVSPNGEKTIMGGVAAKGVIVCER